ncbi:MAG: hypothetical protein II885_07845 [Oscillospiraceae bacterium]|nr:hypothetical protein [Oscillospiraceae bacterium]
MTLQQQAYRLIDSLPDDSVQVVIQVMQRMLPEERQPKKTVADERISPKMKAYLRMKELRRETALYDISQGQRDSALEEKFGSFA